MPSLNRPKIRWRSMTDEELDELIFAAAERKALLPGERPSYPYPQATHVCAAAAAWWALQCLHQDRPFLLWGGLGGWCLLGGSLISRALG